MSNINIKRVVENMRSNTSAYTPLVEMIVNAIQAIEETGRCDGRIQVRVVRSAQISLDDSIPEVIGLEIEDNGIGFTAKHRDSFDTLYSELKINEGGKGFGRFTALRHFDAVHFESVFQDESGFHKRSFSMGTERDFIVAEHLCPAATEQSGTIVTLSNPKRSRIQDKKLTTIARHLVERLLPYLIADNYHCPEISLSEQDGSDCISLNEFVSNELATTIREVAVARRSFSLPETGKTEEFRVRVFKIFSPSNQKSRVSLVAHKREVTGSPISKYVPEFEDEFSEGKSENDGNSVRNFIIKAYVFGDYLDRNVSLERTGFEFEMESGLWYPIGQVQIEREAASIAQDAMGAEIRSRQERKKEAVQSFVDERAPWHKSTLSETDLAGLPMNPIDMEIDSYLHRKKFERDIAIRRDVSKLLTDGDWQHQRETVSQIVEKASASSKDQLIHYIAFRRTILDLFERSLQIDEEGAYSSEGRVHDIIFPRKGDSDTTPLDEHNLWIVDERLNFTSFITSDIPLSGANSERPDLLVYDHRVVFRGDNEESNPITIFEFKKPQRDDFVNPSSKEDPVQQVIRYVNNIRDGKYKTREGRTMRVADNTPFYGYVICDLTRRVETWLEREKNFKPMPDRQGWFQWLENINLYIEVISWDKVLTDAINRNRIFFNTLGI